jgi:hypothetical protein
MVPYKMSIFDILEELKESFNYYSINDVNMIYEFIKRNETNINGLHYDKEKNLLSFRATPPAAPHP